MGDLEGGRSVYYIAFLCLARRVSIPRSRMRLAGSGFGCFFVFLKAIVHTL